MRARPHERFGAKVKLDPSTVSSFAATVGDTNPLHHDSDYAAQTRYGRRTASGPQTTAHLMALTASHFSQRGAMVGLEFWFRFKRPIFADETIDLEWLVVAVKEDAKLKGEVVELRGRIRNEAGETAIGAKGRVLVTDRL
jgi:3-hydroxybutyryl-CoA dehydratase